MLLANYKQHNQNHEKDINMIWEETLIPAGEFSCSNIHKWYSAKKFKQYDQIVRIEKIFLLNKIRLRIYCQ